MSTGKIVSWLIVIATVAAFLSGCASEGAATQSPAPAGTTAFAPVATPLMPTTVRTPTSTASQEPAVSPDALRITWGEWWYEGEYTANANKYPADAEYHERSFNARVTIRNNSGETVPGEVVPVFHLTDGEGERAMITWYYSPDDLRPLKPGEEKEAVFRALTYAPGQWVARAEIRWRGQVWGKEFPKQ